MGDKFITTLMFALAASATFLFVILVFNPFHRPPSPPVLSSSPSSIVEHGDAP